MKKLAILVAAAVLFPSATSVAQQSSRKPSKPIVICDRLIDDFSTGKVGQLPLNWRARKAHDASATTYRVQRDGARKVLHAVYANEAVTIGTKVKNWDLDKYPILQWEWKAVVLPKGGNERSLSTNDSAASVYAIWEVGFPLYVKGIRYSWSSTVPIGTHIKRRFNHDHILVKESGSVHRGQWRTVRVNVKEHQRSFFSKKKPSAPDGIALLTDADATKSRAEAYYANFRLCRLQ